MFTRLRSLFRSADFGDDIDREISAHLAMEIAHRQRQGMSAEEARRTALRDFGGVEKTRQEVRDARGMTFWDVLVQDVRFGLRSLRRSPGYTVAAVTILALGIGANTAMFSVINGVLIKPLPFRNQGQIVLLQQHTAARSVAQTGVSLPEYYAYRDQLKSVTNLVEYHQMSFTLLRQGDPATVNVGVVSANFFGSLGVPPLIGRDFVEADDELGAPAVLLLTYEYWQSKFGSDPKIVGKVVEMNDKVHTIIGVLPPFPQYPGVNDVYMSTSACPFRAQAQENLQATHRAFRILSVFGWLKPNVTASQATAEINTVANSFTQDFSQDYANQAGFTGQAVLLKRELVGQARPMLVALTGATLLVLIIACANVANLSIARTVRRGRELAVRTALGAARGRIARQLVTESLLVAIVGGLVGLAIARVSLVALVPFIGRFTSRTGQIEIDASVLAFTIVAAVLTGVICGVAPALGGGRGIVAAMREGAVQGGESPARRRVRSSLVVAQVAVSFVLLIGAALLLSSVYRMSSVPLGYDLDRVIGANIGNVTGFGLDLPQAAIVQSQKNFWANTLERLRQTPGIAYPAATNLVPMTPGAGPGQTPFTIVGQAADSNESFQADVNSASDGYFETLGVPVIQGRVFEPRDASGTTKVAVINAEMAKAWKGRSPIGSYVIVSLGMIAGPAPEWQIVGVVPDVRLYGAASEVVPQIYLPLSQLMDFGPMYAPGQLIVRSTAESDVVAASIHDAVRSVAPDVSVENVSTLATLKRDQLSSPALTAGLLTSFAGVALLITLAGIAGLIGTSVTQRTREFGVRLALGARPWAIVRSVMGHGLVLVGLGIAAGLAGAYAFSQILTQYLFKTTPTEASAYLGVALVFLAAAALAAFAPAKRITAIDPLKVLRND